MTSSTWLQHLQTLGAVIDAQAVSHFGDPKAERKSTATGSVLADLSHRALLEISGEDAQTFLQGQVTSDVRELANDVAQYSSHCNAKGRMLACFLLWRETGAFRMMLPASLAADTQKRLAMFVLRSKVKVANVSEQVMLFGLAGPLAASALSEIFTLPATRLGLTATQRASLIRLDEERFLLACPVREAPALWDTLSTRLTPVGAACWDWLDIRDNIPVIHPQTRESFIPQMVHLDKLGGIGLNKGCYVGQEVVARAHYLGKIKRHLVQLHMPDGEAPQPGEALCIQGGDGQAVGELVSAGAAPDGGYDMLAVIKDESAEGKLLSWKTPDGPAVMVPADSPT